MTYFSGTTFTPVPEAAPLPAGHYHLHMAELLDGKGSWYVMRMDSRSGRNWLLAPNPPYS